MYCRTTFMLRLEGPYLHFQTFMFEIEYFKQFVNIFTIFYTNLLKSIELIGPKVFLRLKGPSIHFQI